MELEHGLPQTRVLDLQVIDPAAPWLLVAVPDGVFSAESEVGGAERTLDPVAEGVSRNNR